MFSLSRSPLIVRRAQSDKTQKEIFLTFDDGPDALSTPQVLDLLQAENTRGNFFVIGTKARENPALIARMLREGHGVFSHSVDHDYRHYFTNQEALELWIQTSLTDLNSQTQVESIFFRPPAGVLTPPLIAAATRLKTPLILWNHRFFDSTSQWSEHKAQKSLQRLATGDIILLHDRQSPARLDVFLQTLKFYIRSFKAKDFHGAKLSLQALDQEVLNVVESRE